MFKMKWQNPGVAFFGGGGGSKGTPSGPTEEEKAAALKKKQEQEAKDAAEASAGRVEGIAADPSASLTSSTQEVNSVQAQLDELNSQLEANPALQTQVDALTTQLKTAKQNQIDAEKMAKANLQAQQQGMIANANTNPSALIEQAQVATSAVTPDTLIDEQTGQVGSSSAATSTVDSTAKAETPENTGANTMDASLVDTKADAVLDGTEAATADPSAKATVRGQLELLMDDFEGGGTPVWASGPMRQAMQVMQARGMGASSVAGAAVVQAAMESAIGVATQDASTNAQFEMQNLTNQQQTTIFKTQQRMGALFSDQAATNAASQFNATSKSQTDQFFASLESTASQFNAAQVNAITQFNAGQKNAQSKFNATLDAQRKQFNAQNSLVISQANAQWRQSVTTAATASTNVANLEYARNVNAITGAALDQIWQRERDLMDYAFTSHESSLDRAQAVALAKLSESSSLKAIELQNDIAGKTAFGSFVGEALTGILGF